MCFQTGADGDCGDDYDVRDGSDGGGDRYTMTISLIMMMIYNGDDEYLNSYLLGSQT